MTAKVVTLAQVKGGSGKTTVAISLATELHARGHRVLAVDCDPQRSLLEWSSLAAASEVPCPTVVALDGNLRAALPDLAEGRDVVILDTPGRASGVLGAALTMSDLALIPCQPTPGDLWGVRQTLEVIEQGRHLYPDMPVGVVLNGKLRAAVVDASLDALEEVGEMGAQLLKASLGRRVAFAEAWGAGRGATTYASSSMAANEVRALVDEVTDLIGFKTQAARQALRVVGS